MPQPRHPFLFRLDATILSPMADDRASDTKPSSFLRHAKLIGGLTLLSRFFGLGREIVAGHYLGTALVGTAFTVAFVVPNLFRKLFGEGALSAAFIPLYAKAVKTEEAQKAINPTTDHGLRTTDTAANEFAAAAVNLLVAILIGLTVTGEAVIGGLLLFRRSFEPDRILMLRLTAVMLPYVVLICGGAFLSGILQVHKKFGPPAAAPIILNACHIAVLLIGARLVGLTGNTPLGLVEAKQKTLAFWLAGTVLVAGVLQLAVLLPALRQTGFRFRFVPNFWTPAVKRMLLLSLPVALGAGVLQLSVMLDKGISWFLMQDVDRTGNAVTRFTTFGHSIRLPMELGAPRRLDLAQFLYQFPLGIFAIALATAIFPGLSADALEKNRDRFRVSLRHGIEASLWEGLPASVGLMLVAQPATRLMFQHGQITGHDAGLIARSAAIYAAAIWAFSLLQIVNRAYYAVHDTVTPLVMSVVNIVINLVVEIPLLWVMGESGMAVGTVASFAIQAVVMLWMLHRKIGGLHLRKMAKPVLKMLVATGIMAAACLGLESLPHFPAGTTRGGWAAQLALVLVTGAGVYLAVCKMLGVTTMNELLPKRRRRRGGTGS
jgi:putative peptidoglycan lipid II flippase